MTLRGHLHVQFPDDREEVQFRFEVSSQDEAILRQYADASTDLMASVRRVGGLPVQLNMSARAGEGVTFHTEEPTDDQRAVILHRLRPLILKKEPASFERVCGIVRRCSDHEFLSQYLRRLQDIYSGADIRDMIVISRGDFVINSEAAFQHWLNGFEYHREPDRAAVVAPDDSPLPLEIVRPIFMGILGEKVKAITLLAYLVTKMLERPIPEQTV